MSPPNMLQQTKCETAMQAKSKKRNTKLSSRFFQMLCWPSSLHKHPYILSCDLSLWLTHNMTQIAVSST